MCLGNASTLCQSFTELQMQFFETEVGSAFSRTRDQDPMLRTQVAMFQTTSEGGVREWG